MASNNDHDKLFAAFEAENAALERDGEAFVGQVNRKISMHEWQRRAFLVCAALIGAVITGLQLPDILAAFSQYAGFEQLALGDLSELTQNTSLTIIAVALTASLSIFAVFATDRV